MGMLVGRNMGRNVEIDYLSDPRVEARHYYNLKHSKLIDLGLYPHSLSDSLLDPLMNIAPEYPDRINRTSIPSKVNWPLASKDARRRACSTG
jgi:UDP-sulfoquinovose synthase